jgi:hypothetical protein
MTINKSYEGYLLGLYGAMLSDIARSTPSLQIDCERDYKRLLSAVNQHGLFFIFETLPSFSKHFERCLANERLTLSGLIHFGPFRSGRAIPRLFKGLLRRVFDDFGVLRSDPDVQAIRSVRQLCRVGKRFRMDCPDPFTWKQVNEFFKTDGEIATPTLCWDVGDFDSLHSSELQVGDHLEAESAGPDLLIFAGKGQEQPSLSIGERLGACDTIQRVADILVASIGGFDPTEWRARHGPGAVSDQKSGSYKYEFPNWPDKLDSVFPMDIFAFSDVAHAARASHENGDSSSYRAESPAKLIAVPKTYTTPRLIASEPVSHQWCQQILRDFLMSRVSETFIRNFISFDDQTGNGKLALEASKDGSHATIDLSSASDRLSCHLVERIFRRAPTVLNGFYAVRTRWIRQDIDKKSPQFYRLRKFSTMGSALTFPVQSLVFLSVAIGCALYERKQSPTFSSIKGLIGQVRVFGDDIIVPKACSELTVGMLVDLGFKVNTAKTFQTGKFRESCGVDAYGGNDVTPVSCLSYPTVSKPESVLSSVDTHNNFYKRGWYAAAQYIRNVVERTGRYSFRDVEPGSGAIGWYSPMWFDMDRFKKRFSQTLHRVEYLVTLPIGKASRQPVDSDAMMLQYFTEVVRPPISNEIRLGSLALRHPLKLRRVWVPG